MALSDSEKRAVRNLIQGTMSDQELARELGRTVSSVRSRRLEHTTLRFIKTPRHWKPAELRLLGKYTDADVARKTGRFLASVRNKRIKLGIPKLKER